MKSLLNIIYLEDNPHDVPLVRNVFMQEKMPVNIMHVDCLQSFLSMLQEHSVDLIFSDYYLPGGSGLNALAIAKKIAPLVPFIFVSGVLNEGQIIETIKKGATDYVSKSQLDRLPAVVRRALHEVEDHKARQEAERQLERLAFYDTLTGLPNRNRLELHLEEAISVVSLPDKNTEDQKIVLLIVNINGLKHINQVLGYERGDVLIKEVGRRLFEAETGFVARLGGDDFVIVFPITQIEGIQRAVSDITNQMKPPCGIDGLQIVIDVSIGVALCPEHGTQLGPLIQRAYVAMYLARGENMEYSVYAFEQDHSSRMRLSLLGELRPAMDRGELTLFYQPQVDCKTDRVVGVEALIRWQHPDHGLLTPDQFMPAAEETAIGSDLALWVLKEGLRQGHAWHQSGLNIHVGINVSGRQLQHAMFVADLSSLLHQMGTPHGSLHLELTEKYLIHLIPQTQEKLNHFKKMGIHLYLDDFGTGYASLRHLRALPLTGIKIDKSFIMAMGDSKEDVGLVKSVIDMAHTFGLLVVAEGVETEEALTTLSHMGCDVAQGKFISRPLSISEINEWFTRSPWKLSA